MPYSLINGAPARSVVLVDALNPKLVDAVTDAAASSGLTVQTGEFACDRTVLDGEVVACVVEVSDVNQLSPISHRPLTQPPTIVVAGPGEGVALQSMRLGAWDVTPAPATAAALRELIHSALASGKRRAQDRRLVNEFCTCSASLTQPERKVLDAVVAGKLNKQIASELDVSIRTIEQRRRRVFAKMKVESAVPLARRVAVVETLRRMYYGGAAPDAAPLTPVE